MKWYLKDVKNTDDYDCIITFDLKPNWFESILRIKPKTKQYKGSCTVWHHYPSGKRCGILTESWLSDVWTKERWKNV